MQTERKTILVVDDEENSRLGLCRLLTQQGYDVTCAKEGAEALEILGRQSIHLIISDISMPGMNGLSFLREINRRHPSTAVIMITAFGEIESYIDAMNLGAYEYLHKPIRTEELNLLMDRLFASPLPATTTQH